MKMVLALVVVSGSAFGAVPQMEDIQKIAVSKPAIPWEQERVARFVDQNRDSLSLEMAQGSGTKIAELSDLAGCGNDKARVAFVDMVKGSFDKTLVSEPEVSAHEVASNLKELVQDDQALAVACFY